MPRQTGKSTTCVSYLLHYVVFNDSVNVGILANKAATARELLGRLQTAYGKFYQVDATRYYILEQRKFGTRELV